MLWSYPLVLPSMCGLQTLLRVAETPYSQPQLSHLCEKDSTLGLERVLGTSEAPKAISPSSPKPPCEMQQPTLITRVQKSCLGFSCL